MRVHGTVKDAANELTLEGAKLELSLKQRELAVIYSDHEGRFEHKETAQYIGETLICRVGKKGFKPQEATYTIVQEEIQVDIELVPNEEEKIELKINVKDANKNPLEGVKIFLEADGTQVGISLSDKNGIFRVNLSSDLKDKTIKYKAELEKFRVGSGEIQLKRATSQEIILEKLPLSPSPEKRYQIIAAIGVGVIIAIIIIAYLSTPPKVPQIKSFEVTNKEINQGESIKLTWETVNAKEVTLNGEQVEGASGEQEVKPEITTSYVLIAKNDHGEDERDVKVEVKEPPKAPQIKSFEATNKEINQGESVKLTWETVNAKEVTLNGEQVEEAIGEQEVKPEITTSYVLIAKNDHGEDERDVKVEVKEPPKAPQINYFKAIEEATISGRGILFKLTWETVNAKEVTLDGDKVEEDGKKGVIVKPGTTSTYVLIARNDKGNRVKKEIRVEGKKPPLILPNIKITNLNINEIIIKKIKIDDNNSYPVSTLEAGKKVTLTYDIQIEGGNLNSAIRSFTMTAFIKETENEKFIEPADSKLEEDDMQSLRTKKSISKTMNIKIPNDIEGNYNIGVAANYDGLVEESKFGDNIDQITTYIYKKKLFRVNKIDPNLIRRQLIHKIPKERKLIEYENMLRRIKNQQDKK